MYFNFPFFFNYKRSTYQISDVIKRDEMNGGEANKAILKAAKFSKRSSKIKTDFFI